MTPPPVLLAITDRRRMGLEDVARLSERHGPRAAIVVRERDLQGRALLALASEILARARPNGTPVLVSDRADVARILGIGVQLPEDGLDPAEARRIVGPQAIVSASRHDPAGVAGASGADWIVVSPVFATPSKPGATPMDPDGLARAIRAAPPGAHLYALGGIDRATIQAVWPLGVAGVAAIRAAWTGELDELLGARSATVLPVPAVSPT